MIYSAVASITLVLITGVLGFASWGTPNWWLGALAGVSLALVWFANHQATKVLSAVGWALLIGAAFFGLGQHLDDSAHAFFNGMSLAMPVGLAISAWWRWDRFRPILISIARVENVKWLLRLLGDSF